MWIIAAFILGIIVGMNKDRLIALLSQVIAKTKSKTLTSKDTDETE